MPLCLALLWRFFALYSPHPSESYPLDQVDITYKVNLVPGSQGVEQVTPLTPGNNTAAMKRTTASVSKRTKQSSTSVRPGRGHTIRPRWKRTDLRGMIPRRDMGMLFRISKSGCRLRKSNCIRIRTDSMHHFSSFISVGAFASRYPNRKCHCLCSSR